MEENKLKIGDYLLACIDFEKTQDPKKLEEINSFINKIECREYIPLKEKEMIMMKILVSLNKEYDAPGSAAFLEMGKISFGLLAYCTNIENDVAMSNALYHAYDLFYQFGLVDAVLEHCEKDYDRLMHMLDMTINFDNIARLVQTSALFTQESYDKWEKNMSELQTLLDQDSLKGLLSVVNSDNDSAQELLRELQKTAVDSANEEMKKDHERIQKAIEFREGESKEEGK